MKEGDDFKAYIGFCGLTRKKIKKLDWCNLVLSTPFSNEKHPINNENGIGRTCGNPWMRKM